MAGINGIASDRRVLTGIAYARIRGADVVVVALSVGRAAVRNRRAAANSTGTNVICRASVVVIAGCAIRLNRIAA